jgi:SpoVK/Ycf46/Vps4 family AAA+-type ATPase
MRGVNLLMSGVHFDNNFEEMKKSIKLMEQKAPKGKPRASHINAFLLEKHSMEELLKYAEYLTERYGPNAYFKTAASFKGHFKSLRKYGWIVEEKDGLYQIVGHEQCTKIGSTSSGQELIKQKQEANIPTKADATTLLLKAKKQIILYGPPGTGKTFNTKTIALNISKKLK